MKEARVKPSNYSENCTEKQGEPFPHFHGVSYYVVEVSHNVKKLLLKGSKYK